MGFLTQILSVTALGLRSVPLRLGTSMVVVVGVTTVVAVFISVLAVAAGFEKTMATTGSPTRAIVLSGGSDTESGSNLSRENVLTISNAPGIRVAAGGRPVLSADALAFVPLVNQRTGVNAFATLRGMGPQAFELRPEIRIVEGRAFRPGLREVIVGRAAQTQLGGLAVGSRISLPQGDWVVVGAFESTGDLRESELLTDAQMLLAEYRRNGFNSMTVALQDERALESFRDALTTDPTLSVQVMREDHYFSRSSQGVRTLLRGIAFGIAAIMAFGTAFGALNTMYAAVSARAREIATLRALGFAATAVVVSVLLEALLLALAGGAVGAALSWLLINDAVVSTMSGTSPSQITFQMQLGPAIVVPGILAACLIGLVGGLFGALRASRVPVATGLRAL